MSFRRRRTRAKRTGEAIPQINQKCESKIAIPRYVGITKFIIFGLSE